VTNTVQQTLTNQVQKVELLISLIYVMVVVSNAQSTQLPCYMHRILVRNCPMWQLSWYYKTVCRQYTIPELEKNICNISNEVKIVRMSSWLIHKWLSRLVSEISPLCCTVVRQSTLHLLTVHTLKLNISFHTRHLLTSTPGNVQYMRQLNAASWTCWRFSCKTTFVAWLAKMGGDTTQFKSAYGENLLPEKLLPHQKLNKTHENLSSAKCNICQILPQVKCSQLHSRKYSQFPQVTRKKFVS